MDLEIKKISLAHCKKGLQSDGSVYTDEEVILIRDFLYKMAGWEYEVYLNLKKKKLEAEKNSTLDKEFEQEQP